LRYNSFAFELLPNSATRCFSSPSPGNSLSASPSVAILSGCFVTLLESETSPFFSSVSKILLFSPLLCYICVHAQVHFVHMTEHPDTIDLQIWSAVLDEIYRPQRPGFLRLGNPLFGRLHPFPSLIQAYPLLNARLHLPGLFPHPAPLASPGRGFFAATFCSDLYRRIPCPKSVEHFKRSLFPLSPFRQVPSCVPAPFRVHSESFSCTPAAKIFFLPDLVLRPHNHSFPRFGLVVGGVGGWGCGGAFFSAGPQLFGILFGLLFPLFFILPHTNFVTALRLLHVFALHRTSLFRFGAARPVALPSVRPLSPSLFQSIKPTGPSAFFAPPPLLRRYRRSGRRFLKNSRIAF